MSYQLGTIDRGSDEPALVGEPRDDERRRGRSGGC